ncbi:hypothetical protein [Streptomyces sp. NBC_00347]|uniref:hypothetical protein n=1 Tax=Streptomyces sp. NBC_00347 TaxID=2975721 RepID=UPI002259A80C|nr:hypothetical protein [Streptomyces sp. NBC_00347]MCX5130397.1 hypothetical protein [Streptomyces sp. NBC_00347]
MRFLQGAGAAMGAIGFAAAGGASLGILISGLLTQGAGWHWVFYVNVPIGAAAALLAARLIPDDKGPGLGAGADLLGAALVTTGMMLGVYALATGSEHGWGARTLGFSAGLAMPAVMTLSMSVHRGHGRDRRLLRRQGPRRRRKRRLRGHRRLPARLRRRRRPGPRGRRGRLVRPAGGPAGAAGRRRPFGAAPARARSRGLLTGRRPRVPVRPSSPFPASSRLPKELP